jgi:hypothetical protein
MNLGVPIRMDTLKKRKAFQILRFLILQMCNKYLDNSNYD